MFKHELRKLFIAKRNELTAQEISKFNERLFLDFQQLITESVRTVHVFLPIIKKKEADTWPLIRWLWENRRTVVVPEMDAFHHRLITRELRPDTRLQENTWGVPQPVDADRIDDLSIDMVVLPLLAYDVRGYRVGYGSGYYDGFLSELSSSPIKVGLSFFPPVDEITDIHSGDVKMDVCITPNGWFTF